MVEEKKQNRFSCFPEIILEGLNISPIATHALFKLPENKKNKSENVGVKYLSSKNKLFLSEKKRRRRKGGGRGGLEVDSGASQNQSRGM